MPDTVTREVVTTITKRVLDSEPTLIGISLDVIATTIIAMIGYTLGQYFTSKLRDNIEIRARRQFEVYFYSTIGAFLKRVRMQCDEFTQLADALGEEKMNRLAAKQHNTFAFEQFEKISQSEAYNAVVANKAASRTTLARQFSELYDSAGAIKGIMIGWVENFHLVAEKHQEYELAIREQMSQLTYFINTMTRIPVSPSSPVAPLYTALDPVFVRMQAELAEANRDPFVMLSFIEELSAITIHHKVLDEANELLNIVQLLHVHLRDLIDLKITYADIYRGYVISLEESSKKLETIITYVQSRPSRTMSYLPNGCKLREKEKNALLKKYHDRWRG